MCAKLTVKKLLSCINVNCVYKLVNPVIIRDLNLLYVCTVFNS